ncbi:MAG: alpha/beta hydrolase, partial [Solirubrobacteraceae bacterium]
MLIATIASAAAAAGIGAIAASTAAAAPSPTPGHYQGNLPDGAQWIADVPANWNGVLLLYSHGFGPLVAADAPGQAQQALLNMGYALAGSQYDPHGSWWALGSAVRDQFETLATVEQTVLKTQPKHVYAVGTSMGGLISALEDQNSNGRLDGALTTCGIVAGANNLNQYQLDGEYALSQLLAPTQHIQLTNFVDGPNASPPFGDSGKAAGELAAAATAAQQTPQGQARLALAMAFMNVSPWGGTSIPSIYDFPGQEAGQYQDYFTGPFTAIAFIVTARQQLEAAAGGEGSGTVGVD